MNDKTKSENPPTIDWIAELDQHGPWLRSVVATRCGERHAVDEVMQEVSMAVIDQASPLRDPTKVAPWLYQVAVRQSLMYRRKHGRRRNLERKFAERMEADPGQDSEPNPLDWLITNEKREFVRRGIDGLNPKDAEILLLKYTQDWSYQQIAEHLDTSASAVESRLHRARKKLRTAMSSLLVTDAI